MAQSILIRQQPAAARDRQRAPSNIKSIILHVQDDGEVDERLHAALLLARAAQAHLRCVHVTPAEAYVSMKSFGGVFTLEKAIHEVDAREAQLRAHIEGLLQCEDVSWDYEQVTGNPVRLMIQRSALCDIMITGRPVHRALGDRPNSAGLGEILLNIGIPLLVCGGADWHFDPLGPAVIAWNGSFEAANAVRAAIGLLKLASEVRVIRYSEDKRNMFADSQIMDFLSRHGIDGELDVREARRDFSDDLVEYASMYGAGYIVMGAYSHSRASEILFGGVTRDLLHGCPVSLVLSR
ncbi:MAG TPA: universal stress protein [Sphingomicrobium sp.]|nr:universal stress protein [Sphingomicrobium sp.]